MRRFERVEEARQWIRAWRTAGLSVGFVPTLGALHEGHASLLRRAASECDRVVASIWLNPTQFDSSADLDAYPRTLEADRALCDVSGVDLLLEGRSEDFLPDGFDSEVRVEQLTQPLCGAGRPGHFRGVTTVVAQLLHAALPHRAYFGLKDFQQARVIARMVRDLLFDVEMRLVPTSREADGLARSSRNVRLSAEGRRQAPVLWRSLRAARALVAAGEHRVEAIESCLSQELAKAPLVEVEYARVVRGEDLRELETSLIELRGHGTLIALAARVESVRLIDNVWMAPEMGAQLDGSAGEGRVRYGAP